MLDLFGLRLHPHPVLEGLGYFAGARLYFALRRRSPEPPLPLEANLWILVGALFGAFFGAKILAWLESPAYYLTAVGTWRTFFGEYTGLSPAAQTSPTGDWSVLLGGKTIVGALLGGWAGVEFAKRCNGVRRSTGDLFVYPLALGTAIGRVGCFLTGLPDHTYGVATTLPWGVDFGDGVMRHPTQLYESLFVLLWAGSLWWIRRGRKWPAGVLFRVYVAGYLTFRFAIEFIKPRELAVGGLSAIQLACLGGLVVALASLVSLFRRGPTPTA